MIQQKPFNWPDERTLFVPQVLVSKASYKYQEERNKLIPYAEAHADRISGKKPKDLTFMDDWNAKWNRAFFGEMDRLWNIKHPESLHKNNK
jgi:hypothetical protein